MSECSIRCRPISHLHATLAHNTRLRATFGDAATATTRKTTTPWVDTGTATTIIAVSGEAHGTANAIAANLEYIWNWFGDARPPVDVPNNVASVSDGLTQGIAQRIAMRPVLSLDQQERREQDQRLLHLFRRLSQQP